MMPYFWTDWGPVGPPPVVYGTDIVECTYDDWLDRSRIHIAVGDEEKKEKEFYDIWQDVENAKT